QSRTVQKRPSRSVSQSDSPPGLRVGEASGPAKNTHGGSPDDALPVTTLSLLREWLPPSTADCVITALQAANLTNPTAARPPARQQQHQQQHQGPNADAVPAQTMQAESSSQTEPPKASATQQRTRADSSQAASDVTLETDPEGVPWMIFSYVQKGKPKWHRIRIDVDRAPLHVIPQSFQKNNCVYPRANCHESAYTGNRWDYETTCNVFGWQLAFLNQELLSGRRGLLQSAVNKYRDKVEGHKSRRITRLEKSERSQRSKPGKRPLAKPPRQRVEKRPRVEGADPTVLAAFSAAGTSAAVAAAVANAVSELPRTLSLPQMGSVADGGAGGSVPSAVGGLVASAPQAPSTSAPVTPAPASVQSAQSLTVSLFVNNQFMPIDVDINFSKIDDNTEVKESQSGDQQQTTPEAWARKRAEREQFKQDHAVFPRVLDLEHSRYGGMPGRWEFELTCNEMAWKLALLNERLRYRMPLIQKCIDTYRTKFAQPPWGQLRCSDGAMDRHVSVRFYDLWIPRPGRRRLVAVSRDAEVVDQATAVSHNTSLGSVPIQQAKAEGNPTKDVVVVTQSVDDGAAERPASASSTGSETAARLRIVRPKSSQPSSHGSSGTPLQPSNMAAKPQPQPQPQLPKQAQPQPQPQKQKQAQPMPQQPAVSIRPSSVRPPIAQTPQVRPSARPQMPPTQQQPQKQQKQQQQSARPHPPASHAQPRPAASPVSRPQVRPVARPRPPQPRPAPAPTATSSRPRPHPPQHHPRPLPAHTTARPSAAPAPRPPAATSPAPRPAQAVSRPPGSPARATSGPRSIAPAPAPGTRTPQASSKSAKAQVAASVLTDVLRRFAKTDPALAQLTSVLKEPQEGPMRSTSEEEEPLDAKVAELEKLLTELQK
ncbi:hypothetical protein EC988_002181, partial [Linderina pennispora]